MLIFIQKKNKLKAMGYLQINRIGRVKTNKSSSNQCKEIGHKSYEYQISVICDTFYAKSNIKKILVEHVLIHETVQNYFHLRITSCEGICMDLAVDIQMLMEKFKITPYNIYIKIRPLSTTKVSSYNTAWMEYSSRPEYLMR